MAASQQQFPKLGDCPHPTQVMEFIFSRAEHGGFANIGSFSTTIYDTAWLAMVPSQCGEHPRWLFPESFAYLLHAQKESGTWTSGGSMNDSILSTLAALLALKTHAIAEPDDGVEGTDLERRMAVAHSGLGTLLSDWDADQTLPVGFEIIVPSLLRQLGNHGTYFTFSGYDKLMKLNMQKMEKFQPEIVYSKQPSTILHSLEALVGVIDFDRVGHHCHEEYGIFGSPSATAAYLANASAWNLHAEHYLKETVRMSNERGAVPSAYPTSIFELSWVMTPDVDYLNCG